MSSVPQPSGADYDQDAGTLKVRGKGNKERLAHLGDASQAAIDAWLFARLEAVVHRPEGRPRHDSRPFQVTLRIAERGAATELVVAATRVR
jgi:site-specific recombinase XerC